MPDLLFWHILASPGYTPETIAVNVTWMERGFNAGQMRYLGTLISAAAAATTTTTTTTTATNSVSL